MNEDSTSLVQSDKTMFAILEELKARDVTQLSAIASKLGLANSTVYDHLATLRSEGYVTKQDGQYKLGLKFLDLGVTARNQRALYHVGRDAIDQLASDTGEKVWLTTEEEEMIVGLYLTEGKRSIETPYQEGDHAFLLDRAAGLAILACWDDERIQHYVDEIESGEITGSMAQTSAKLLEHVEQVRETNVVVNQGQVHQGINSIAAPIRGENGDPVGAITFGGPEKRLSRERLEAEFRDTLLEIVNEIEVNYRYFDRRQG